MLSTDLKQTELFDADRWPKRPYCSNELEAGTRIRTLRHALLHPYIQANPPHLRVWSIHDVDRPGAMDAWELAGLPPPSWAAMNRQNGHAHLVYGLSAPVLVDGLGARDAPLRYLCAVESMMREALRADPGYAGLLTKNPAHSLWYTLKGPRLAYDLVELAEYLPGIEKHRPKKRAEEVGLGRNVTLFDALRKWAYKAIKGYEGGGLDGWNAWVAATNSRGLIYNADFANPLDGREVWHIAKSVAKWTHRHMSAEGFSVWQAHRSKQGHKARWGDNSDKKASARLMQASGMTQRAIADELGVDKMTVNRWLKSGG